MMEHVKKEKLSTSKIVEEILTSKPFIQDLFLIDVVNYSGLARHLVPEIQKRRKDDNVNMDAVIMAVKRFGDNVKGAELSEEVRKITSECSIFVKNDLTGITVKKSNRAYDVIRDSQNSVDYLRGEVIYVLTSTGEIEIVTERKVAKELLKKLDNSEIVHIDPALALIGIRKPERARETPGVLTHLSGFLAMNDVSLMHTACIFTEINFIVHEIDASKAYTVLDDEIKKERERYADNIM